MLISFNFSLKISMTFLKFRTNSRYLPIFASMTLTHYYFCIKSSLQSPVDIICLKSFTKVLVGAFVKLNHYFFFHLFLENAKIMYLDKRI